MGSIPSGCIPRVQYKKPLEHPEVRDAKAKTRPPLEATVSGPVPGEVAPEASGPDDFPLKPRGDKSRRSEKRKA